jgi:hypothetical protein
MRSYSTTVTLTAAIALLACSTSAPGQLEYEFTLVDSFVTDYSLRECYIYDINDLGVACGTATIRIGSTTTYTGFYWTAADGKTAAPVSWPRGISNTGLIAGVAGLYDIPSGQSINVPLLPSTYYPLVLLDVNDSGVAVGYVQTCNCSNSQGFLQVPYVWDVQNGARSIPVAGANGASRINSNGLVVGWIGGNSAADSYVYDLNTGQYTILSSVFEGSNIQTTAVDVTDDGVVLGARKVNNGLATYGYTWSSAAGVTLLPLPPAGYQPHLRPTSLNRHGIVVGAIYTPIATSRAFVYDAAHGVRDLHELANVPPGFTMMSATRVNDRGTIVGYGYGNGGMYKSFVLTPIVPNGDVDGDGDVDLGDLASLLSSFGLCVGAPGFNPSADFDHSDCVELADLATLLASFGT